MKPQLMRSPHACKYSCTRFRVEIRKSNLPSHLHSHTHSLTFIKILVRHSPINQIQSTARRLVVVAVVALSVDRQLHAAQRIELGIC